MIINIRDIKIIRSDPTTSRVRKDFGSVSELAESIKRLGLIHPIVIDEYEDDKFKYVLVAGERRLRAVILNGETAINASLLTNVDSLTRKEIEVEENLKRKELGWLEQCRAVKQLDELKREKYGGATQSRESKGWGLKETAKSLGLSLGAVGQDIKLAKDIETRPDLLRKVAHLPKHAARKVIARELETEMMKRMVERKEIKLSVDLLLGPAEKLIKDVKSESVHLIVTDPPFGVDEIIGVAAGGGSAPTYNITESNVSTPERMMKVYKTLIPEMFRVLVPGAHIYIFFGHSWYTDLYSMLTKAGFIVDAQPIIWDKLRTSLPGQDLHYMSCYEAIFFGHKPPPNRILKKSTKNVISIPAISPQCRIHGLQKPFDLLKIFIDNSSNPGELVLDCFAGSAATLVAARKLQRRALGFELDTSNFYAAQKFMDRELGNV